MTNRREFLRIGIAAASTWPLAAEAAEVSTVAVRPVPLYKAVYDVRFQQSKQFAGRAAQLGVAIQAIGGDMTRFWYDDLDRRWKQGAVALAGLTTQGPLFCFEQLAMSHRMRVVLRARHLYPGDGRVDHEFFGPVEMLHDARAALGAADWAARMADLVARCPSGRSQLAAAIPRPAHSGAREAESLYSWVIAPTARAAGAGAEVATRAI
jgi:hypothetical protein